MAAWKAAWQGHVPVESSVNDLENELVEQLDDAKVVQLVDDLVVYLVVLLGSGSPAALLGYVMDEILVDLMVALQEAEEVDSSDSLMGKKQAALKEMSMVVLSVCKQVMKMVRQMVGLMV